jgi:uncharacterized protein (DUF1501 family)
MPVRWFPNDDEHRMPPPPTPEWLRRLHLNRRTFLRVGLGSVGLSLAAACAPAAPSTPEASPPPADAGMMDAPNSASEPAGPVGATAAPVRKPGRPAAPSLATPANSAAKPAPIDAPILVVVQLSGGNDGLNTVVPYTDNSYYQNRPTLAVAANRVLPINDTIGLHPNLGTFKQVWDTGDVALLQGVGYPNPNRSHFRSMDIWHTAEPATLENYGWLGKYLDLAHKGTSNPFTAVNVGSALPKALWARETTATAIRDIAAFQLRTNQRFADDRASLLSAFAQITARGASGDPYLELINKTWTASSDGAKLLQSAAGAYRSPVAYPAGNFARGLQIIASLIHANLGTRVFYTQLGGFDDHAAEKNQHDRRLTDLGDSLAAFYHDLKQMGVLDKVLVLTFTEFGRRVRENASAGTDHGAAQPLFVIGGRVKGGIYGAHPSLSVLDDGDLKFDIDFRTVYNALLTDWLNVPGRDVLGQQYETIGFLES